MLYFVDDQSSMCGILGILRTDNRPFGGSDNRVLNQLTGTLKERGPDGHGTYSTDSIGFAHHRLAIRDLSQGDQPWVTDDGNCVLVYNGELYNDQQLRKELHDFPFRTQCDTEVVMAAYLRWGRECIQRFEGMFAFGLYDRRERTLWLVRDRFGIKPLFFAQIGHHFVFASRVATITSHPEFSKHPDWDTVSHYLSTTRLTLGRRTMYLGVNQLQAAEEMTMRGHRVNVARYWDYPTQEASISYVDAVDQLQEDLDRAVRARLTSDVPVGLFLSGGVDSSTLATLVQRADPCSRYATCATTDRGHDNDSPEHVELANAMYCARQVGARLHPVHVDGRQYLRSWQQLIRAFGSPLSTPSDVMIYEIAKAARQEVGVVIGGEGADELLCGYEIAHWAGNDYDATLAGAGSPLLLESVQRQYGRTSFRNEADHYFALNSLVPQAVKSTLFNGQILALLEDDRVMLEHYQQIYNAHPDLPTIAKNAIVLHQVNLEALLARLDATTMHAGLEARVPFTDHMLVEHVFQMPMSHRIAIAEGFDASHLASAELSDRGGLRSKRVLRSVASRLLPTRLANRKKASFPTGVNRWFQEEWIGWVSGYLAQSPFAEFLLDSTFRGELIAAPQSAGMWLWPVTNLCLWGDLEFFAVNDTEIKIANASI